MECNWQFKEDGVFYCRKIEGLDGSQDRKHEYGPNYGNECVDCINKTINVNERVADWNKVVPRPPEENYVVRNVRNQLKSAFPNAKVCVDWVDLVDGSVSLSITYNKNSKRL